MNAALFPLLRNLLRLPPWLTFAVVITTVSSRGGQRAEEVAFIGYIKEGLEKLESSQLRQTQELLPENPDKLFFSRIPEPPAPFAKDLVGAWRGVNFWTLLINTQRQGTMVGIQQSSTYKMIADGRIDFHTIWKNPEVHPSTEFFGALRDGKIVRENNDPPDVYVKISPALVNAAASTLWMDSLKAGMQNLIEAKPHSDKSTDLTGIWRMQPNKNYPAPEFYLLFDAHGKVLWVQIRDCGQMFVDDRGNVSCQGLSHLVDTLSYFGTFHLGQIVQSQGDYENRWSKCLLPAKPSPGK